MEIRKSGEDYLEAILILERQSGAVRSIDLARHMGYMIFKNGVKSLSCGVALSTLLLMAMNRTPFFGKRISV